MPFLQRSGLLSRQRPAPVELEQFGRKVEQRGPHEGDDPYPLHHPSLVTESGNPVRPLAQAPAVLPLAGTISRDRAHRKPRAAPRQPLKGSPNAAPSWRMAKPEGRRLGGADYPMLRTAWADGMDRDLPYYSLPSPSGLGSGLPQIFIIR